MSDTTHSELVRQEPGYDVWRETSRPVFKAEVIDDAGDPVDVQEIVDTINNAQGQEVTLEVARTTSGKYIGTLDVAEMLCTKRGIAPETMPGHKVCSIGFCEREQKWFGWSHRAIYGFKVGDVAKEGDCVCSSGWTDEYLAEHPEDDTSLPVGFEAKTLADAKRMAIAFAESVG